MQKERIFVMSIQLSQLSLPQEVLSLLANRKYENLSDADQLLIGKGGYTAEEADILEDAIIALTLGKNVLLKGPTGSGKTKLAETLSYLFHQPMHSINCSIDMDAEALLGFKTIENQNGLTSIEF